MQERATTELDHAAPDHAAPDHHGRLREAGLRVTQPRLAVLDALAASPHADTDAVATAVRSALGTVSTQAVYDVLRAL